MIVVFVVVDFFGETDVDADDDDVSVTLLLYFVGVCIPIFPVALLTVLTFACLLGKETLVFDRDGDAVIDALFIVYDFLSGDIGNDDAMIPEGLCRS